MICMFLCVGYLENILIYKKPTFFALFLNLKLLLIMYNFYWPNINHPFEDHKKQFGP